MKTIGLIGGTTWVSTLEYYKIINRTVNEKLGGFHSARCILYSVDFDEDMVQHNGKWTEISKIFVDIAKKLERSGADFIVICANTMHIIADDIQKNIDIPILHIVDATAEKIVDKGLKKVGLLGTKYTMEEEFYIKRFKDKYNIDLIVPEPEERKFVHDVIINELANEKILKSSKEKYIEIIDNLASKGAEGIILGCTEIPLLIKKDDCAIQIFDTTTIHAKAAANFSLKHG